jgi:hypothetical protein
MRSWLPVAAASLALQATVAHADRDPLSGAPLPPAQASVPSPITDHFSLSASFFDPGYRTSLRADPSQPSAVLYGTPLNGEHDLGFPGHQQLGEVEAMLRMRERNRLRVDYFESDRNGGVLIGNPVIFGSQTFPAGTQLASSFDWRLITVTYTYSFWRSDRLEIGSGLAGYAVQLTAQLQAPATFQQQTVSASGAVPAIPLDVSWRVSRRFSLTARAAYFRATVKDDYGEVIDLHSDAQFRWNANFTTGVGYRSTRTALTRSSTSTAPGVVHFDLNGPEAFVRFSF